MPSRLLPGSRKTWRIVLGLAAAWGLVVSGLFVLEWTTLMAGRGRATVGTDPIEPLHPFAMPGIVRPPAVDAGASTLTVDEEVLGFVVGGKARAYRLNAFRDRSRHLVNDLIGEVPVTVAYCDINDCARGYTKPGAAGPLEVSVGGLYEGREMVLEVSGRLYYQESGAPLARDSGPASIPLESLRPTRTTWGEWKRLHPSTDVYEGVR